MKRFVANRKGPWQKRLLYIGFLCILLTTLLVSKFRTPIVGGRELPISSL